MGGGSYSVNPTSTSVLSVNSLANLRSDEHINDKEIMKVKEDDFMKLRRDPVAPAETHSSGIKTQSYETPAGKIKYKTPVSIGLGVSYYVNGRWSLQSGLTYTLLRSEGKMGDASDRLESKQNLHYIGIPLSVAFRIAEWKRFQLYASAGGMGEYNVAGTYKETVTSGDTRMTNRERVHMKEPMWSVNARAGINYPLWRFVHVYAEAGASYYFDNKSEIKTIRSDKPFNASLQAGFRLGF
jgi:hypothetical protein